MVKSVILYFSISRVLFIIFSLIAVKFIALRDGYLGSQFDSSLPSLVSIWANFDGRHFLSIATVGYEKTNFAYFPLYSLLISLLGLVLPLPHLLLGIFISALSFILALIVIYKIIRLDYDIKIASISLVLLSFFPLSFFYHSVYTDSLFLLLTVCSFYFARKKNWWLAGLFCGLSTATRLSGVALIFALLVEWYLQNKSNKQIKIEFYQKCLPMLALGSLGIISYLVYLQVFFGDFLLFQKSFSAWGQSNFTFPPQVIWRYLKIFFTVSPNLLVFWIALLEFVTFISYSLMSIYVLLRVRVSYGVFMLILLSLVTFTGTFAGTPRYALHMFPMFLGLAIFLSKRKYWRYLIYVLYIIFGFLLTALFTRGYFVA